MPHGGSAFFRHEAEKNPLLIALRRAAAVQNVEKLHQQASSSVMLSPSSSASLSRKSSTNLISLEDDDVAPEPSTATATTGTASTSTPLSSPLTELAQFVLRNWENVLILAPQSVSIESPKRWEMDVHFAASHVAVLGPAGSKFERVFVTRDGVWGCLSTDRSFIDIPLQTGGGEGRVPEEKTPSVFDPRASAPASQPVSRAHQARSPLTGTSSATSSPTLPRVPRRPLPPLAEVSLPLFAQSAPEYLGRILSHSARNAGSVDDVLGSAPEDVKRQLVLREGQVEIGSKAISVALIEQPLIFQGAPWREQQANFAADADAPALSSSALSVPSALGASSSIVTGIDSGTRILTSAIGKLTTSASDVSTKNKKRLRDFLTTFGAAPSGENPLFPDSTPDPTGVDRPCCVCGKEADASELERLSTSGLFRHADCPLTCAKCTEQISADADGDMALISLNGKPIHAKCETTVVVGVGTSSQQSEKPTPFFQLLQKPEAADVNALLKQFIANFSQVSKQQIAQRRLVSMDKQAARIHRFVEQLQHQALPQHPLWRGAPDDDDGTLEGLEKYVTTKLYAVIFRAHATEDTARSTEGNPVRGADAFVDRRMFQLRSFLKPQHLELDEAMLTPSRMKMAIAELHKMNDYKAPRDKLVCILNCCKVAYTMLQARGAAGADEFLPLLIWIVICARPGCLASNLCYIQAFRNERKLQEEMGYYFTQLHSAVTFVERCDASVLSIDPEEFAMHMILNDPSDVDVVPQDDTVRQRTPPGSWRGAQEQMVSAEAKASVNDEFADATAASLSIGDVPRLLLAYKRLLAENREYRQSARRE